MAKEQSKAKTGPRIHKAYKISGNKIEKVNRFCPKCGVGSFMAKHANRETCGKCGYTEMSSKKK